MSVGIRGTGTRLAVAIGVALVAVSVNGVSARSACAGDVTGTCGALEPIFSGKDEDHARTVLVKNTGDCPLQVVARKRGESQPEEFQVQPGAEASRNGKFARFTVRCLAGKGNCKARVTSLG